tara:strand:- start:426 stop:659 length:234 start_codon:yes stop_codon:yes gene_type:complete
MSVVDPYKTAMSVITSNPIGAVAGAGATFFGVKKYAKVSKWWMLIGLSALGAVGGAYAQKMISAKSGSNKSTKETKK